MAEFNPQVKPNQDPSYLGLSKSITQPTETFGKALGTLFSSVGNVFDKTVDNTVTLVKENLSTGIRNKVDEERTAWTSYLESAQEQASAAARGAKDPGKAGAPAPAPLSLISNYADTGRDPPPGLQNLPQMVEKFQSAGQRAKGSIDDTAYQGRLAAYAKEIRAAYPGFRDYIDEEFKKLTGNIPANVYYKQTEQNLNTYLTNAQDPMKKFISNMDPLIFKEGASGIDPDTGTRVTAQWVKEQVITGKKPIQWGERWANNANAKEWDKNQKTYEWTNVDLTNKIDEERVKTGVLPILTKQVANHIDNVQTVSGADGGPGMGTLSQRLATMTDDEALLEAKKINLANQTLKQNMRKKLQEINKVDGRSMYDRLGADKAEALLTQALAPAEEIAAMVGKKEDLNTINYSAAWLKAMENEDTRRTLFAPGMEPLRIGRVLEKVGGKYLSGYIQDVLPGMTGKSQYMLDQIRKLQMGTKESYMETGVIPAPVVAALDHYAKIQKEQGLPVDPKVVNLISVGMIKQTLMPAPKGVTQKQKDDIDTGIFLSAFHPDNRDMLKRIVPDGYNSKGLWVDGKAATFYEFTSPQINKRIKELNNPQLSQMHENWATQEYFNNLFRQDLIQLKDASYPNASIQWKPEKLGWEVVTVPQSERAVPQGMGMGGTSFTPREDANQIQKLREITRRLNEGLTGLADMYKQNGKDVEMELGKNLIGIIGHPNPGTSVQSPIPDKMLRSLTVSRMGDMIRKGREQMLQQDIRDKNFKAGQ